jgi:hypothetical protein
MNSLAAPVVKQCGVNTWYRKLLCDELCLTQLFDHGTYLETRSMVRACVFPFGYV